MTEVPGPTAVTRSVVSTSSGPKQVRELSDQDTVLAYEAMLALRPNIGDAGDFVRRVRNQRANGYRLVAVVDEQAAVPAAAVAGFRVLDTLAWGRCLYVDDLTTVPGLRRAGCATTLLLWLQVEAEREGCDALHLDSGFGQRRAAAHRVYLKTGMAITSLHFSMPIAPSGEPG